MMETLGSSLQWELAAWIGIAILAAQFVGIVLWVLFGSHSPWCLQ